MDRRAWWAAVHEVTKSRARLGDWHLLFKREKLSSSRIHCCCIILTIEFKLSCLCESSVLGLKGKKMFYVTNTKECSEGKKKKGHLSFPAPWEFQTSVSFLRAPGPSLLLGDPGRRINLRRNWLSQPHALRLFCPVSLSVVLPLRGFLKDAGWAGSSILPLPAVFSMSCSLPHGSLTAAPCLAHTSVFRQIGTCHPWPWLARRTVKRYAV